MTNAELIARIKAEIEKRYAEYREKMKSDDFTYYEGMADALDLFEQFIDTLESEKTMQDGLEEEIDRVWKQCSPIDEGMGVESTYMHIEAFNIIARHFAEWGAEHFRDTTKKMGDSSDTQNDLEEAAKDYTDSSEWSIGENLEHIDAAFIAGAKWQERKDEKEQADLFTIVALDAAQRAKEQMMKDIPKWHKVQRGSCFDKHTNFLLSAREGHFYCSSIEVPRDGYILLVDELERLPKEDEK